MGTRQDNSQSEAAFNVWCVETSGCVRPSRIHLQRSQSGAKATIEEAWDLGEDYSRCGGGESTSTYLLHIVTELTRQPAHMVKLILSIPPDIVTAVICGNVESRKHQDPKFEVLLDKYARLEPTPGIYLNILCRGKWDDILPGSQIPMVSPNAGKGLSLRNLKTLHERLALYMEDTSEALKYVDMVDRAMPSAKPQSTWRVYLKPDRDHEHKVKEFMGFLEQEYLSILDEVDDPLDPIFDAPMDRCFSEIGWSKNAAHRATNHLTHDGTTALFGLVHAIMRVEWGSDFTITQYQIVRVWDRDDAALAEAAMSVIASSYWYDGGMNMFFAGEGISKGELENEDMKQPFRANHLAVFLSGLMQNNIRFDKEKIARTKEIFARRRRAPEVAEQRALIRERYEQAKKELLEAAAKEDDEDADWAVTEVKDLVASYAQDVIKARETPVRPGDFDVDNDAAAPVLNPQG
jgi:hypothetical protein